MTNLYYECHVTVPPLDGHEADAFQIICAQHGFRVAKLLLRNSALSRDDSFCTTRGKDYADVRRRMTELIAALIESKIPVWRYKIEDTILDSRISDPLNAISKRSSI